MKLLDSAISKGDTQTAKALQLQQTFESHPIKGITPAALASILDQAETGDIIQQSELFKDIEERDPHIYAELSKRKRTVIGLPWSIVPPYEATAQELESLAKLNTLLSSLPDFEDMLLDLLDAIGHGFSCVELTWANTDGIWAPVKFMHRPQSWFKLDTETRSELRLREGGYQGTELWPFGWIVHKHFAKSGYLARAGLFRVLAWPWLMKQFSLRDLAEYLEIYGLPVKIGKYPRSAPEEDKDNLSRAIQQLGRSVSGVMPDDMSLEFLKESLGSSDPFMGMVNYCDSVISQAILGQTLSSSSQSTGLGSGVANLHGEVRQDLLEADAAQLSSTLSAQLINPLLEINGWASGRKFSFVFDTSTQGDLNLFASSIKLLSEAGLSMPEEWVRKKAGIPEPSKTEKTIGGTAKNQLVAQVGVENIAALSSVGSPDISNYPDKQIDKLDESMSPIIAAVLKKIRTMLDESRSLDEFDSKLLEWFPEAEALDMVELLTNAFAATGLAGRFEVAEGG